MNNLTKNWLVGLGTGLLLATALSDRALAQEPQPSLEFCQISPAAAKIKEQERLAGNTRVYQNLVKQHAAEIDACRRRNRFKTQAIWLRLYPCDLEAGRLDQVMDRITNRGYNQVYIEVFYDGLVLLPQAENTSPWRSVLNRPDQANTDLLAIALTKARERGMSAYAWFYTLNFGYGYGIRSDRADSLARNGKGETTLMAEEEASKQPEFEILHSGQAFVDPYDPQARADLAQILTAVLRRQPDGVLFDYVRYKRGRGGDSIASNVKQLWIYGKAAQQALLDRASNDKGRELIRIFLQNGNVTNTQFNQLSKQFAKQADPLWQGQAAKAITFANLNPELWALTVRHAYAGVVDFLAAASTIANPTPTGAVFFPEGNQVIRSGFDSRLQNWPAFTTMGQWHPMSYALCGSPDCIVAQIQRVLESKPAQVEVIPVLAGYWGRAEANRPSLEQQMQAIAQALPEVDQVSHFAFSWQEIELERSRQTCRP
ncbi:MAG: family 10 glycosylhydrolase [Pseudanabaenaceae cyanobacterium bins.68]|nr:family 10 glycosylhydrolase [Pseudanabaenaceae cyanobacterium bins.68]